MKIKNRFLHYFLLAIVIASALTTTLSPIVSAKPLDAGGGSAAGLPVDSMTPSQAAKSWLYYYALTAPRHRPPPRPSRPPPASGERPSGSGADGEVLRT